MNNKNKNEPIRLEPIADSVDIESRGGLIKLIFFTSRLEKTLLPNHIMKLSEVVLDSKTAEGVANYLIKHANRGKAEAQIKKTPLPDALKPKKKVEN